MKKNVRYIIAIQLVIMSILFFMCLYFYNAANEYRTVALLMADNAALFESKCDIKNDTVSMKILANSDALVDKNNGDLKIIHFFNNDVYDEVYGRYVMMYNALVKGGEKGGGEKRGRE